MYARGCDCMHNEMKREEGGGGGGGLKWLLMVKRNVAGAGIHLCLRVASTVFGCFFWGAVFLLSKALSEPQSPRHQLSSRHVSIHQFNVARRPAHVQPWLAAPQHGEQPSVNVLRVGFEAIHVVLEHGEYRGGDGGGAAGTLPRLTLLLISGAWFVLSSCTLYTSDLTEVSTTHVVTAVVV